MNGDFERINIQLYISEAFCEGGQGDEIHATGGVSVIQQWISQFKSTP